MSRRRRRSLSPGYLRAKLTTVFDWLALQLLLVRPLSLLVRLLEVRPRSLTVPSAAAPPFAQQRHVPLLARERRVAAVHVAQLARPSFGPRRRRDAPEEGARPLPLPAHALSRRPPDAVSRAPLAQIFIFGGEYSSPSQTSFHHWKDLWQYDVVTNEWEQIETKVRPSPRSGCRMALWKNWIVLFGGFYDCARSRPPPSLGPASCS